MTADWTLEVKWDGWRAQLRIQDGSVSVRTRSGRDVTARFPELAAIAEDEQAVAPRVRIATPGDEPHQRQARS